MQLPNPHSQMNGATPVRPYVPNPSYRVSSDLRGDWWIWRRSSQNSWTTFQRCNSEAEAQLACDELLLGGTSERSPTQIKS